VHLSKRFTLRSSLRVHVWVATSNSMARHDGRWFGTFPQPHVREFLMFADGYAGDRERA
jgi:hypothetical protein